MTAPPFPQPQGPVPEDRTYENYVARTVEPSVEPPPPVYMSAPPSNQTPSYSFIVEEPPPYVVPKEADETAPKKRRVCGMTWSSMIATIVILIAAGVIAGGVYGYQQKIKYA